MDYVRETGVYNLKENQLFALCMQGKVTSVSAEHPYTLLLEYVGKVDVMANHISTEYLEITEMEVGMEGN